MCQKSLNFIYAFKCYQQNVSGFTLAGPPCILCVMLWTGFDELMLTGAEIHRWHVCKNSLYAQCDIPVSEQTPSDISCQHWQLTAMVTLWTDVTTCRFSVRMLDKAVSNLAAPCLVTHFLSAQQILHSDVIKTFFKTNIKSKTLKYFQDQDQDHCKYQA